MILSVIGDATAIIMRTRLVDGCLRAHYWNWLVLSPQATRFVRDFTECIPPPPPS
jgi:hypothetical protein